MVVSLRKSPCSSCPYRLDCPSGVWAAEEYDKLPGFDGDMGAQAMAGALGLFMCHNTPAKLCAGWLATHGPDNLLALRLPRADPVPLAVWGYTTAVPVHPSGAAAAAHGKAHLDSPTPEAVAAVKKIVKVRPEVGFG